MGKVVQVSVFMIYTSIYTISFPSGNARGLCEKGYLWWHIGAWLWGTAIYIINISFKDNNLKLRGNITTFVSEV